MLDSGVTLESDVYLASHHGSEGSSSEAFMRAVSPTAVVVSAGAGNSYGHPTRTVLDRVKACGQRSTGRICREPSRSQVTEPPLAGAWTRRRITGTG